MNSLSPMQHSQVKYCLICSELYLFNNIHYLVFLTIENRKFLKWKILDQYEASSLSFLNTQKQIKEIIRLIALPILFQCQCKMELPYSCPLDTRGIRCSDLSQWKKYRLTPLPQKNALTPGQEAKAVWLKSRFEPF